MPARVTCEPCKQTGHEQKTKAAAEALAPVHDRLIHRGQPTATVVSR